MKPPTLPNWPAEMAAAAAAAAACYAAACMRVSLKYELFAALQ
jgi:hypothetical protein